MTKGSASNTYHHATSEDENYKGPISPLHSKIYLAILSERDTPIIVSNSLNPLHRLKGYQRTNTTTTQPGLNDSEQYPFGKPLRQAWI